MSKELKSPPMIRPGDGISVVMPASAPDLNAFIKAMDHLVKQGYQVKTYRDFTSDNLGNSYSYLAGNDSDRADELNAAFADKETRLVLAARGGYGVARILDLVDFSLLASNPKAVCGYSDLTALHAAIQKKCSLVSILGPNLIDGWGSGSSEVNHERKATIELLEGLKAGSSLVGSYPVVELKTITQGRASGRLVGGNLAVLNSLLGTPYEPDWDGAILFLEEIGESPYRIDRMLTQLRQAGVFDRVAGILLGYFTDCQTCETDTKLNNLIQEMFSNCGVPVVAGFPSGHEHPNYPLPMGAKVKIDSDALLVAICEELFAA